jgi:hypothetical protein
MTNSLAASTAGVASHFRIKRIKNRQTALCLVLGGLLCLYGSAVQKAGAQDYLFGRGDFLAGYQPVAIATADFNGDGRIDLAVVDKASRSLAFFSVVPTAASRTLTTGRLEPHRFPLLSGTSMQMGNST